MSNWGQQVKEETFQTCMAFNRVCEWLILKTQNIYVWKHNVKKYWWILHLTNLFIFKRVSFIIYTAIQKLVVGKITQFFVVDLFVF